MTQDALRRIPLDWPHRASSRVIRVGSLEWHVQVSGTGPVVLLLHGTGASAHSWADVMPVVALRATVVAPDLPGHGFTQGATLSSLALPVIALELDRLCRALGVDPPRVVVGHSAGAALALRWALGTSRRPQAIVGFNPALLAPPQAYGRIVAPLITPFATSAPIASLLAALAARTSLVRRLLASTQSSIPEVQRERYERLFRDPSHLRGAMGLMAAADLPSLLVEAGALSTAMTFVLGERDGWVPLHRLSAVIERALPAASLLRWAGGHLLHEEEPARAGALVVDLATRAFAAEPG